MSNDNLSQVTYFFVIKYAGIQQVLVSQVEFQKFHYS
jgi:hypothetical protein